MTTGAAIVERARTFASLVKLSHSVFALPFALLSLLAATAGRPPLSVLLLVIAAVVSARTAAMAYNRYADREIDRSNPHRGARDPARHGFAVPRLLTRRQASCSSESLLALVAALLSALVPTSPGCRAYSHMKRFSALCHVWPGIASGCRRSRRQLATGARFGPVGARSRSTPLATRSRASTCSTRAGRVRPGCIPFRPVRGSALRSWVTARCRCGAVVACWSRSGSSTRPALRLACSSQRRLLAGQSGRVIGLFTANGDRGRGVRCGYIDIYLLPGSR
jgi:hypothetical protein